MGEGHLRRVLKAYAVYYNNIRTYLSLAKDAPLIDLSSGLVTSLQGQSWAAFITNTAGSGLWSSKPFQRGSGSR